MVTCHNVAGAELAHGVATVRRAHFPSDCTGAIARAADVVRCNAGVAHKGAVEQRPYSLNLINRFTSAGSIYFAALHARVDADRSDKAEPAAGGKATRPPCASA